jgi:hypothetical protein
MMPVGSWRGDEQEVSLPRDRLPERGDGCAFLLQTDDSGHILGAATWRLGA